MIVGHIDDHLKNKIANLITSSHFPWQSIAQYIDEYLIIFTL